MKLKEIWTTVKDIAKNPPPYRETPRCKPGCKCRPRSAGTGPR